MKATKIIILKTNPIIRSIVGLDNLKIDIKVNSIGPLFIINWNNYLLRILGKRAAGRPIKTRKTGPAKAPTIAISVYPIIEIDISATISRKNYFPLRMPETVFPTERNVSPI